MGFFDDFASALETYITDSVTLSTTNVDIESGTSGAVNVNEIVRFKVKVENAGNVNMTNVVLHASGDNGATISTTGPGGPFQVGFQQFGSLTVGAGGGSQKSDYLYFQGAVDAAGCGHQSCDGPHLQLGWRPQLHARAPRRPLGGH